MAKEMSGMALEDYAALLFRQSMTSTRPRRLAVELRVSESYVHKFMEGERPPSLPQWLETILITGDLEGVRRLVRDLGGVVAWRRGSLAAALRELAAELEAETGPRDRGQQWRFPREGEG